MKHGPEVDERGWFRKAAEKIVREGKNIRLVLDELGIDDCTGKESEDIFRSKTFQGILRNERLRYANEIAKDPELRKESAIGLMLMCAQNLIAEGEWDKASEAISKLARLMGWQGSESNVNIFTEMAGLKQNDILELRKRVESKSSAGNPKPTDS